MKTIVIKKSNDTIKIPKPLIDSKAIDEQVRLAKQHQEYNQEDLFKIISCIDLTRLDSADTYKQIDEFCLKFVSQRKGIPKDVAAICVYPSFVEQVKKCVDGIKIATVTEDFPSGHMDLSKKISGIERAIEMGASEVDMVIPECFLLGDYQNVFDEISKIKLAVGDTPLKVILEVEKLCDYDKIRFASDLAMYAGADFIKTSTGKVPGSFDHKLSSVLVITESILDFYKKTKKKVGLKVSGGVKDTHQAVVLLHMVDKHLGKEWLNPNLFRIGASQLLDDIIKHLS